MKYKKLIYGFSVALACCLSSCLKVDNYGAPQETVHGQIVDANGRPVYANAGASSVRIKMLDYGFSDNPSEYYLNVGMDGSYANNKIFASTYTMVPQGPFVPVAGQEGVQISGNTEVNFVVEPFFVVEWREPALVPNGDGTVTANVRVTRGTSNPAYQANLSQAVLFISTTQYVGSNNYDTRLTPVLTGTNAANFLANNASITSIASNNVSLKSGYTYFVRVGVRGAMNGEVPEAYNFSEAIKLVMP
ncbi:DUF3823 domain-containing protein [Parapedobacter koreensis]|uniref:DUF3823 domain-containing protein n=1 Tax=Parapedobacter koreensis TaxID=332977 RepID=A0A1H7RQ40_9SPHI|nr:DUF3823 domain-containing protein [Parapedobacter koreensis]SEL62332.1 Protein of unknown function [Parapedobacter koreensis]